MMDKAEKEKDAKDIIKYIHLIHALPSSDKYFPSIFIAEQITNYIKGLHVAYIFYSYLPIEIYLFILVNERITGVNDKYELGIFDGKYRQLAHKRSAYGQVVIGDEV